MLQAPGQRAEGTGHGARINDREHRQAKALRQIGRAQLAIEEAHDPFHNDEVGIERSLMQALRAVGLARHPQIKLVHQRAAGKREPVRVKKIRAALENTHLAPLPRM